MKPLSYRRAMISQGQSGYGWTDETLNSPPATVDLLPCDETAPVDFHIISLNNSNYLYFKELFRHMREQFQSGIKLWFV